MGNKPFQESILCCEAGAERLGEVAVSTVGGSSGCHLSCPSSQRAEVGSLSSHPGSPWKGLWGGHLVKLGGGVVSQSCTCISGNVHCFTEIVINLQKQWVCFLFLKKYSYSHALQKIEKCQLLTSENTYYRWDMETSGGYGAVEAACILTPGHSLGQELVHRVLLQARKGVKMARGPIHPASPSLWTTWVVRRVSKGPGSITRPHIGSPGCIFPWRGCGQVPSPSLPASASSSVKW